MSWVVENYTLSTVIFSLVFLTGQCQIIGDGVLNAQKYISEWKHTEENFHDAFETQEVNWRYMQQQQHGLFEDTIERAIIQRLGDQSTFFFPKENFDENIYNVSRKCLADVFTFLTHLRNMTASPWALQMLDAYGKLPSGVLQGDFRWLGGYDQCRNITAYETPLNGSTQTPIELFKGKYCLANIHQGNQTSPTPGAVPAGPGASITLSLGICIPDSCSDIDAHHLINTDLFPVNWLMNKTDINADLVCTPELSVGDDWRAILAIVICSILGVFILLGTLYDVLLLQLPKFLMEQAMKDRGIEGGNFAEGDGIGNTQVHEKSPLLGHRDKQDDGVQVKQFKNSACQFLLAFSLYTNGTKLLSTKQGANSLKCLNGVRFLSMSWVMLGHSFAFGLGSIKNLTAVLDVLKRWSFLAVLNGTYSVDSFFFLSGLLVTYLVMKEMDRKGGNLKISWGMYYFHRFWRLTPPYMLVLMVDTCLYRYLGEGPMWPHKGVEIDSCAHTWWHNLLYINNFFPMQKQCFAWAWYLANDMQFYVIAPLILIPLYRSWKLGGAVWLIFLMTCLISTGAISSAYDIPVGFADPAKIMQGFDKIYITPWCRIGPYLVGMATGYILYKTNCQVRMKLTHVLIGWAVAAICCLSVLYGVYDVYQGHPMSTSTAAFYNAMSRTVWGVGLGWLVFACSTGYGGFINTFLSWEPFIPLGRLTYCAYLIHPLVQYYFYLTQQTLIYFNDLNEIYLFLGNLVMAYGLAFITSLVFEAPFMGLEKVLFKRDKSN